MRLTEQQNECVADTLAWLRRGGDESLRLSMNQSWCGTTACIGGYMQHWRIERGLFPGEFSDINALDAVDWLVSEGGVSRFFTEWLFYSWPLGTEHDTEVAAVRLERWLAGGDPNDAVPL